MIHKHFSPGPPRRDRINLEVIHGRTVSDITVMPELIYVYLKINFTCVHWGLLPGLDCSPSVSFQDGCAECLIPTRRHSASHDLPEIKLLPRKGVTVPTLRTTVWRLMTLQIFLCGWLQASTPRLPAKTDRSFLSFSGLNPHYLSETLCKICFPPPLKHVSNGKSYSRKSKKKGLGLFELISPALPCRDFDFHTEVFRTN